MEYFGFLVFIIFVNFFFAQEGMNFFEDKKFVSNLMAFENDFKSTSYHQKFEVLLCWNKCLAVC